MKPKKITVALIASLMLALIATAGLAGASQPVVSEMSLNPGGAAWEVHADASGNLWISDYNAKEIWKTNPSTGQYTIYQNMNNASDATMDGSGNVWWTDDKNGYLGRIAPGTHTLTQWSLNVGVTPNPLGVEFDNAGRVWIGDNQTAQIFRLDPASNQLCVYSYTPGVGYGASGTGDGFITWAAGNIWISDGGGDSIIRLNPTSNAGTLWQLAFAHSPQATVIDASGQVWFAEQIDPLASPSQRLLPAPKMVGRAMSPNYATVGALARLAPSTNTFTEYMLPIDMYPQSLYLNSSKVWYTAFETVGIMDPAAAVGASSTITPTAFTVSPSCSTVAPSSSSITTVTGTATWTGKTYSEEVNNSAWEVYQLPTGARPWGITGIGNHVWVTDQGRKILAYLGGPIPTFLPLLLR